MSAGERVFHMQCKLEKITMPEQEYQFHDSRKWRFDFAWPEQKIAVEVEGGTYAKRTKSRHTTGVGFDGDCEKYNAAAENGWRVFRYSTKQVNAFIAIRQMKRVLKGCHAED
ncbi:hypothetical protein BGC07_18500 [Piscirickettsia litoralis]|uniref:DUF559 domain-containing protein n=1 Tax=Piscirickettsia litoralis TaxID=1891921 RepID=A0ABX2ZX33_9GAMM|nr:hypothetical protein BGC07_18500 [Piscirickettsia litoralis]